MYKKAPFDELLNKEAEYVIRIADGAAIPMSQSNRDYIKYLEWLSAGNEPEPADILPE
jgi:hypothetical protein